jgi:hypothetical protein
MGYLGIGFIKCRAVRGREQRKRMSTRRDGSVKKNEDFLFFAVDLIQIAGFMLNQREIGQPSSA